MTDTPPVYPEDPPYHPGEAYPEYPFRNTSGAVSSKPNSAYAGVRELLGILGFDAAHRGTPEWNPLGDLVQPGQTILLKPNWVSDTLQGERADEGQIGEYLVTHSSVVRALMDYAFIAVGPNGRIIVADAPLQNTDFERLLSRCRIPELKGFYDRCCPARVEIRDLRLSAARFEGPRIVQHLDLPGDPAGYFRVNLAACSRLAPLDVTPSLYRVSNYKAGEMLSAHCGGRHEYLISRSVLEADCIISIPKLKTHFKVGMTAALKNIVGINGSKAYLPHFRLGAPAEGGDDYPAAHPLMKMKSKYMYYFNHLPQVARKPVRWMGNTVLRLTHRGGAPEQVGGADPFQISGGDWHGNDTAWRMVLDLNTILLCADRKGVLHDSVQRRTLSLVDGIIGGEGDGPLAPRPRPLGRLIAGFHPVCVDAACAQIIGFDWRKLPLLLQGACMLILPVDLDHLEVLTAKEGMKPLGQLAPTPFVAPHGWKGHVELGR